MRLDRFLQNHPLREYEIEYYNILADKPEVVRFRGWDGETALAAFTAAIDWINRHLNYKRGKQLVMPVMGIREIS